MRDEDDKEFDLKNLEQKLKKLEKYVQKSTKTHTDQQRIIEKYSQALLAAPIATWEWNLSDDQLLFDANIAALMEYGNQFEQKQNGWSNIVVAADIAKINLLKTRCLTEQGYKASAILRGRKGNGSTISLHWSATTAGNELLTGTLAQIPDATENTAVNITLQNIPIGLIIFDDSGRVISINPATKKILGLKSEQQLVGMHLQDFGPFNVAGITHYFSDLVERNQEFDFESPLIQNLAGKKIFVQLRGFERDQAGFHLLLITDITNRKHLEDQYRQLQRLESIGKLAGGIAHDFNNILTIIKGSTALALSGLEEGNPVQDNLYNIQRASERAESLTQQLLAFSRRQLLQPKLLDLNEVIQSIKSRMENLLGSEIRIVTSLDQKTGSVKADQEQIENVLVNLVLNARDAMPEGGTLTIETVPVTLDENYMRGRPLVNPGPYVMLSVSDTGHGMDGSVQAHIFEPFFTTKEKGLGAGMGLATVYGVVKQSSGYIWVYSEVGKGTTFKIYLPQITGVVQPAEAAVLPDAVLRGTETVLVIDDEAEVRNLVSEMLRFYGYKVMEAPNASNALMIFEKYKDTIDIILTDVVMPQMSGIDLVERLMPEYPDTKVLFMSGYTDNVIVEHGLLDKDRNFIQKPFNAKALIQKVREVLNASSE